MMNLGGSDNDEDMLSSVGSADSGRDENNDSEDEVEFHDPVQHADYDDEMAEVTSLYILIFYWFYVFIC